MNTQFALLHPIRPLWANWKMPLNNDEYLYENPNWIQIVLLLTVILNCAGIVFKIHTHTHTFLFCWSFCIFFRCFCDENSTDKKSSPKTVLYIILSKFSHLEIMRLETSLLKRKSPCFYFPLPKTIIYCRMMHQYQTTTWHKFRNKLNKACVRNW